MRDLNAIINQIIKVAPDLENPFKLLKNSIGYSSPEIMQTKWPEAAAILNVNAAKHPKKEEIEKIFAGVEA